MSDREMTPGFLILIGYNPNWKPRKPVLSEELRARQAERISQEAKVAMEMRWNRKPSGVYPRVDVPLPPPKVVNPG